MTRTSGLISSFLHRLPHSSWKGRCSLYASSPSPVPVPSVSNRYSTTKNPVLAL